MRMGIKNVYRLSFAGAVMMLSSCDTSSDVKIDNKVDPPPVQIEVSARDRSDIDQYNSFGFDFVKPMLSEDGNVVFSPLSLQMVLSMLANGDNEAVAEALVGKLSSGTGPEALDNLNELSQRLLKNLPLVDRKASVKVTNSIWCDATYDFTKEFADMCGLYYQAESHKYNAGTIEGMKKINDWCEDKTNGMISDYYTDPPCDDAILINCLYFHGEWQEPFDSKLTAKAPFYTQGGEEISVDMMQTTGYCVSGEENDEVVELTLSYGNQGYYMTLLMPKNFDNFVECVDKYFNSGRSDSAYEYSQGISWDKEGLVKLSMPRFEMQSDFDLVDRLREMGLEFLGTETVYNILEGRGMVVNSVKQKSAIKVDEQGTVASAVTSVGSVLGIIDYFNVTIDRPFFYAIRENSTGAVLFMGKVSQP